MWRDFWKNLKTKNQRTPQSSLSFHFQPCRLLKNLEKLSKLILNVGYSTKIKTSETLKIDLAKGQTQTNVGAHKKASLNFRTSLQYTQKQNSIEKESFSAFESENMIQKSHSIHYFLLSTHLIIIITCNMNIYLHRYVHETREEKAFCIFEDGELACWRHFLYKFTVPWLIDSFQVRQVFIFSCHLCQFGREIQGVS